MELPTKVWPLPLNFINITSGYGPRTISVSGTTIKQSNHGAIDIAAPVGTPVMSIDNGKVGKVVLDHPEAGHYVEVEHPNGHWSRYLHLSDIQVKVGDPVKTGGRLGLSGGGVGIRGAGRTTGPHLHLEIWKGQPYTSGAAKTDPEPYLVSLALVKVKAAAVRNRGLIVATLGLVAVGAAVFAQSAAGFRSNPLKRLTVAR